MAMQRGYSWRRLRGVIHLELDWMRRVLEANDLDHLELDIAIDEIVIEDAARFEEVTVLVQIAERFAQAAAHRRDLFQFFRRQIIKVLVGRLAGIELVLDAVEPGQEHRGKAEIRVAKRIRITPFAALSFRRRRQRNAA